MKNKIHFYDGFIENDVIWFSNLDHNGLMTLNINTGEINSIGQFPEYRSYKKNLHIRVIEHNRLLYFVPRNGRFVNIFDLTNMAFKSSIPLPYDNDTCIANAFIDELGMIWIIPAYIRDKIVIIYPEKKCADVFNKTDLMGLFSDAFIGPNCVSYNDGMISICIFKSNKIFFIDTTDHSIYLENLKEEYNPVSFISDDGATYYFSNFPDNRIISWNKNENKYTIISDKNIDRSVGYQYWNYFKTKGRLICLPYDMKDILTIDLSKKAEEHISISQFVKRNSANPMYSFFRKYKDNIYLFPSGADGMLVIDPDDLSVRTINYIIDEEICEHIQAECKASFENKMLSGIISENIEYHDTLDIFLDFVTQNCIKNESVDRTNNGSKIHNSIKNIINKD